MLVSLLLCFVLAQAAEVSASQSSPPQGDVVKPRSRAEEKWTLDYRPGALRLWRDPKSGEQYWFATFTIANRTGKDRRVAPQWDMLDDSGRLSKSGAGVSSDVTREIMRLLNDPQLLETSGVIGMIAQGEENAKSGLVVFQAGPEERKFALLVSGLSSERTSIKHPQSGEPVTVRKTFRMDFQVPGERSAFRGEVPLATPEPGVGNPSWIMR